MDIKSEDDFASKDLRVLRDNAEEACTILRSIGNPNRLMILCLLMRHEHSVNQLSEATGMRQTLTSQHLARLRADKLVQFRREDQSLIYSIKDPVVAKIVSVLYKAYC